MLRCPAFKMSSASTSTPNALSTRRFAPWPSLPPTTLQLLTGKFGLWARDPWCVYVMSIHFLWFSVFACFLFTVFLSISFWHDFHACSMFNHVHFLIAALLCSPHCHERSVENSLFEVCDLHTNSYDAVVNTSPGHFSMSIQRTMTGAMAQKIQLEWVSLIKMRKPAAGVMVWPLWDQQGPLSLLMILKVQGLEWEWGPWTTWSMCLWSEISLAWSSFDGMSSSAPEIVRSWDRWLCHRKESCILYTADRARVGTGHQMLAWPGRTARHA